MCLFVIELVYCIGFVLIWVRLFGFGCGLFGVEIGFKDIMWESSLMLRDCLRKVFVIVFNVMWVVVLWVEVCFRIGWVLLKLYFCMLVRLVWFGWGCVSVVVWVCLVRFLGVIGLGVMMVCYFFYFELLIWIVRGLFNVFLCWNLVSNFNLLVLKDMWVFCFVLRW